MPSDLSDAANKQYVDGVAGTIIGDVGLLSGELQRKLDKADGGVISGAVKLLCCDLSVDNADFVLENKARFIANGSDINIYNANYLQTTVDNGGELSVHNFSGKNSFLQAEAVAGRPEYGMACTGSRGYYVLKV